MRTAVVMVLLALIQPLPVIAEEIVLIAGFERPEDLELVPELGALVLSEMGFGAPLRGGGISALAWRRETAPAGPPQRLWPAADALAPARTLGSRVCTAPPNPDGFSGHGLSVVTSDAGSTLLAVVGHGTREAIEYFELDGSGANLRARWVGCVELPPNTAGNDVALAPDGSVFVTNYIQTVHGLRAWVWLQLAGFGWDTGTVIHWRPKQGWSELAGSNGPMPNGILRLGAPLVIAYNAAARLDLIDEGGSDAAPNRSISLPGSPDNLSSGPRGGILAAVLPADPPGAWSVARIDPELREVETVLSHDGSRLPALPLWSSTARDIC